MINQAMQFAILAHSKQRRKGTEIPYVFHPFEVGYILAEAKADEEVICAGILHDTIEDAEVSPGAIENMFSIRTAELVKAQSEDKSKSWKERKQHTIDYFKYECKSKDEALICCADKLSNIRSMQRELKTNGEMLWTRFKAGQDLQGWYYKGLVDSLNCLVDYDMYEEFKRIVGEVFS